MYVFILVHCGAPIIGGQIKSMGRKPDKYIFIDYKFEGRGWIAAWEIYATDDGDVYLCVFTHPESNVYKLNECNEMNIQTNGYNRLDISMEKMIQVEKGNVIGILSKISNQKIVAKEIPSADTTSQFLSDVVEIGNTECIYDSSNKISVTASGTPAKGIGAVRAILFEGM